MRFPMEPKLEQSMVALYAGFFVRALRAQKVSISEERALDVVREVDTLQAILDALRAEATSAATSDPKDKGWPDIGATEEQLPRRKPISFFRHPILWLKQWLRGTQ